MAAIGPEAARGSLVVVGTGLHLGQMTLESAEAIRGAGKVFFVVADVVTRQWILRANPRAESLAGLYRPGLERREIYRRMVDRVADEVRRGTSVCAAFYGHPGVLVSPGHAMVALLRDEGHDACMLPGVSSEDALYADLGLDPCAHGIASFEATDFLLRARTADRAAALVLWQVGLVGHARYEPPFANRGVGLLVERLQADYGADHRVCLYEAGLPGARAPRVQWCRLADLPGQPMDVATTLLVPPAQAARVDPALAQRLQALVDAAPASGQRPD